jgi:hypothetical protein
MHGNGVVKPNASRWLQQIHKRALWTAMRAAGGDAHHAAKTLGITVGELMLLLDGDPASMWSDTGPRQAISGMRPKTIPPVDEKIEAEDDPGRPSDDDPDKAAW